jgi:hypothetical protein
MAIAAELTGARAGRHGIGESVQGRVIAGHGDGRAEQR